MSSFSIRPYTPGDREAVREICWHTAIIGEGVHYLYSDRASWVDMYTRHYTDREPESAWVAVSQDGRVVGYLLGSVNPRAAGNELVIGLAHNLKRFLWLRPGTAGFWWRAGWDFLRDLRAPKKPAIDYQRYPAHMHCNLLPEARAQGVAQALFEQWHACLRARGIRGAHGEAFASNHAVHALLRKLGYEKLGAPYLVPALRTPTGERLYGQCVVCDLQQHTALPRSQPEA
jgi:GNAT superfamily N-acetyltransferase